MSLLELRRNVREIIAEKQDQVEYFDLCERERTKVVKACEIAHEFGDLKAISLEIMVDRAVEWVISCR